MGLIITPELIKPDKRTGNLVIPAKSNDELFMLERCFVQADLLKSKNLDMDLLLKLSGTALTGNAREGTEILQYK